MGRGAEYKEQDVGVLIAVSGGEGECAPGEGCIFRKEGGQFFPRFLHGQVKLVFVVDHIRLVHIGADGDRMREVEHTVKAVLACGGISCKSRCIQVVAGKFRADIIFDDLVILKYKALALLVAGEETVKGDDDWETYGLRQL